MEFGVDAAAANQRNRYQHAGAQRHGRCPSAARHAPAKAEYEYLVEQGVQQGNECHQCERHSRAADAIEKAGSAPDPDRESAPQQARQPVLDRQLRDVRFQAQPADNGWAEQRDGDERRRHQQHPADARPCRAGGGAVVTRAEGLCCHGLNCEAGAAEKQDRDDHEPIRSADRCRGVRREAADEPGVRKVQQRLDAAVDEKRHRQRDHDAQVDFPVAGVIELDGVQARVCWFG